MRPELRESNVANGPVWGFGDVFSAETAKLRESSCRKRAQGESLFGMPTSQTDPAGIGATVSLLSGIARGAIQGMELRQRESLRRFAWQRESASQIARLLDDQRESVFDDARAAAN